MKIAVVGSGISGLLSAYLLQREHEVVLYEAASRLGGHTNTVRVEHEGSEIAVDTGFIVFNERNYPGLCRLFDDLGIDGRDAPMTFSVRDDSTGFEYGGESLGGLLARKRNLVSPRFWKLVAGILRFGRVGADLIPSIEDDETLEEFARRAGLSESFLDDYLVPMAGAIWSSSADATRSMPARFFAEFFQNHGMIDLRQRPRWRTVPGGARRYIDAMLSRWRAEVRLDARVAGVTRREDSVTVRAADATESFDQVVLACHSDQAVELLTDASDAERDVLGAMPYDANEAVLHSDESVLPRRRAAWSAWNYRLGGGPDEPVAVTYDMTILQSLPTREHLCVTLNDAARIDPSKVLGRWDYAHPQYTHAGMAARGRWSEISGVRRTHFCGAYWGSGFHEDGVQSALRVCERLGVTL